MGISRRKAKTDEEITKAINAADEQLGIVAPADVAITPTTAAAVVLRNGNWNDAMELCETTLFAQTTATADEEAKQSIARMFISHFFQAFNNGVERGYFTKEQRTFFHLDVNSNSVPTLDSEADIKLWGARIVKGDPLRVAAGGNAMSNPTKAEVTTALDNFVLSSNTQTLKTTLHKKALDARDILRPIVMGVIMKVWDETEAFYNEFPAPTKRAKCRPWGVKYVSDQIITITITYIDSITNDPVADTSTYFVEGDTTHAGTDAGVIEIKTTVSDEATLNTTTPGYVAKQTIITFETGVTEYTQTVKLVKE